MNYIEKLTQAIRDRSPGDLDYGTIVILNKIDKESILLYKCNDVLEETLEETLMRWNEDAGQGDGISEKDIEFFQYALSISGGKV